MNKFVRFGILGIVIIMSTCSEVPKVSSEVPKVSNVSKVSSKIPEINFSKCSEHSVPMPGTKVVYHDCPTVIDLGEIKIFRFFKHDESTVSVIAYANANRPIVSIPSKAAPIIAQYGSQRYVKITILLPPNAPTKEWTQQGWQVLTKATTGVIMTYTKH